MAIWSGLNLNIVMDFKENFWDWSFFVNKRMSKEVRWVMFGCLPCEDFGCVGIILFSRILLEIGGMWFGIAKNLFRGGYISRKLYNPIVTFMSLTKLFILLKLGFI